MIFLDVCLSLIILLLLLIFLMVGVAYITLFERKILGYLQVRKGPNKVGILAIFQPFSDAIKLFSKEQIYLLYFNWFFFYFSPIVSFFLSLLMWVCFPFMTLYLNFNLSVLFFLCCSSLGVYLIMVMGWSSNSVYSLLGAIRVIAQSISYEISLALIFLSFLFMVLSLNLLVFLKMQIYIWFFFLFVPLSMIWFVSLLAETNRTPFDFAEGESELVSGFNIEYGSGGFILIFLAEYLSIFFMSALFSLIFFSKNLLSLFFFFKMIFFIYLFIWVRGTLPRFRYDKLMMLAWKSFLVISLNYMFFYLGLSMFFLMY